VERTATQACAQGQNAAKDPERHQGGPAHARHH